LVSQDGQTDEHHQLGADDAAPVTAEHRGASTVCGADATVQADPVVSALEAALALRRAGADPKALRRALRRIEELLDA
jgi:hypothetical protein